MDLIWEELAGGVPDPMHLVRMTIRLFVAMLVGAVVGLQRQSAGQATGLRTHMLAAMGGALFVLVPAVAGPSTRPRPCGRAVMGFLGWRRR